jgi:uncharacterized membrane protein YccF (DUF307 family)
VKCDVAHEVHFNEVWALECMIPSVSFMLMFSCPVSEACIEMIDLSRIPVGTMPVHRYLYFHRQDRYWRRICSNRQETGWSRRSD